MKTLTAPPNPKLGQRFKSAGTLWQICAIAHTGEDVEVFAVNPPFRRMRAPVEGWIPAKTWWDTSLAQT